MFVMPSEFTYICVEDYYNTISKLYIFTKTLFSEPVERDLNVRRHPIGISTTITTCIQNKFLYTWHVRLFLVRPFLLAERFIFSASMAEPSSDEEGDDDSYSSDVEDSAGEMDSARVCLLCFTVIQKYLIWKNV